MRVRTTIEGRLARDPELKFVANGKACCTFTVMTSRRTKEGDAWVDKDVTGWRCVAWEQFAETLAEQFRKGDAVIVVGDLSENTWNTPEGERRSRIEMRVDAAGWDFRYGVPGAPKE